MSTFRAHKVVAALPAALTPDTVYAVRVGAGFDLYISDSTGQIAHKINSSGGAATPSVEVELAIIENQSAVDSGQAVPMLALSGAPPLGGGYVPTGAIPGAGTALAAGAAVLVVKLTSDGLSQTSSPTGIYLYNPAGAWTRHPDFVTVSQWPNRLTVKARRASSAWGWAANRGAYEYTLTHRADWPWLQSMGQPETLMDYAGGIALAPITTPGFSGDFDVYRLANGGMYVSLKPQPAPALTEYDSTDPSGQAVGTQWIRIDTVAPARCIQNTSFHGLFFGPVADVKAARLRTQTTQGII